MSGQAEMLSDEEEDNGFKNDFKSAKGLADESDDFDDEFTASNANVQQPEDAGATQNPLNYSQVVQNRPYDEAVDLEDGEESAPSPLIAAMQRPGGSAGMGRSGGLGGGMGDGGDDGVVKNQPFDEAMDLSSEGSVDDAPEPHTTTRPTDGMGMGGTGARLGDVPPRMAADEPDAGYGDEDQPRYSDQARGDKRESQREDEEEEKEGEEDQEESDDDGGGAHREVNAGEGDGGETEIAPGMYNPADYASLNVSSEIRELFQYIGRYKPHNIELETKMKPFIPDYIPAVGEIDPFVKVTG
ncbi:intraflagellar transport complex B protein 46 C terminal-domain-containing protein [Pavlovales sp. CCMP2436]|nr:intraflagellar transport complex B protein 46 C terminal-domain-containing protein [Pavlovales sp. CCMP2436]